MTKKDYIRAASITRNQVDVVREEVGYAFIQLFAPDNPRFDPDTFLVACGLQDPPIKQK